MPGPLEGLRVVDIGWLMVGPVSARYLTDLGADTIKVETGKRPDPLRAIGPFKDGQAGPERTVSYHMINAGKESLAVDVKSKAGRRIVLDLVAGADVFIESFTPGQIDEMGFSYAELAALNPRLIMVSTGILGRKGTQGLGMSGTGLTGAAYAGATYLVGWPDREPAGPNGPWTDAVAPRFVVAAILAALHRRRSTGQGVYIDLSQAEAGLQFLSPAYLEFAVNGRSPQRLGTATSPLKSAYGVYRCQGDDRWIAIDASAPDHWTALRKFLQPILDAAAFNTIVGRIRAKAEIDAILSRWTLDQDANVAEARLQRARVPAHVVCHDQDLAFDADLEATNYHRKIEDTEIGEAWIPGPQFELTGTPLPPRRAGPRIGDSTDRILTRDLGRSTEDIAALREGGVLV